MAESLEEPDEAGEELTLDKLTQSFARLMGGEVAEAPDAEPAGLRQPEKDEGAGEAAILQFPGVEGLEPEAYEITPRRLLEAMLFVGSPDSQPLSAERAASVMRGVAPEEIHGLVAELNQQYAADRCPYQIESEGAGYRLTLRAEHRRLRDKFHGRLRQARLSQAAIDVLAIVAYNQPLTGEEVSRARNTSSGAVLSQLLRRRLLRIERDEQQPRVARYCTTDRFLELFGLASLEDLPRTEELD
jgi:segregation and condensation protein B